MGESKVRKDKVLDSVAQVLEVPSDKLDQLPQVVAQMKRVISVRPIVVTVVVDPVRGAVLQVGTSQIPPSVEVYQLLATSMMTLAQQFNNAATEVAKHGRSDEGRVDETGGPRGGSES